MIVSIPGTLIGEEPGVEEPIEEEGMKETKRPFILTMDRQRLAIPK